MYELIPAKGNTYYIDCPAKMGLWVKENGHVYLIDSGNDKEAGKKVLKILAANGWTLDAIISTHSHADHTGGNSLLQERTQCRIYADAVDRVFMEHPVLEPAFLYGGYPPAAIRNKFLMAKPSHALDLNDESFPEELEKIPLPGHYFAMIGVRTPDNVVFCADCLSGEHILDKYHVGFLYDLRAYLSTLDAVEKLEADLYIPAHAEPVTDIGVLSRKNREKVHEILTKVLALCENAKTFEEIFAEICAAYGIKLDFNQYVLAGSTIRSYLAYLNEENLIEPVFTNNRMFWKKIQCTVNTVQ